VNLISFTLKLEGHLTIWIFSSLEAIVSISKGDGRRTAASADSSDIFPKIHPNYDDDWCDYHLIVARRRRKCLLSAPPVSKVIM
jgi:hypothetical protein